MNRAFKSKICGITRLADASMVARSGADAVGLNFYPAGKRFVTLDHAQAMVKEIRDINPEIVIVGVFVNSSVVSIAQHAEALKLDTIQLHGDESVADFIAIKSAVEKKAHRCDFIRAIRTSPRTSPGQAEHDAFAAMVAQIQQWSAAGIDAVLIDAAVPGDFGGTGKQVDWQAVARVESDCPVVLAGGLTCENVARAIGIAKPAAVDVASGVEDAPGEKNSDLTCRFVAEAKKSFSRIRH